MNKEIIEQALDEKRDAVVLYDEIDGDMETPVSLLAKSVCTKNMFLLESAKEDKTYSRYSFLSFSLNRPITVKNRIPLFGEKSILKERNIGDFGGGYVGYLSYEAVELSGILRNKLRKKTSNYGAFFRVERFIVYDNYTDRMYLALVFVPSNKMSVEANYEIAREKMGAFKSRFLRLRQSPPSENRKPSIVDSMFSKEEFMEKVGYVKHLIEEGEAIQVVISNYMDVEGIDPLSFYRALRRINPSPYMYFLKFGDFYIVGSSPEIHIRKRGRQATIKPIAGTKPKGKTEQETELMKQKLVKDEKERAEHLMLVDLARNDLARVCAPDSVKVEEFMKAEEYSHVIHLVSEVNGTLNPDVTPDRLLANTFPAGTLSGAPKVRAIEIIDEVEKQARGPYGGCVGYVGFDGNIDMAITIRTAIFTSGRARLQAGAGIVYDSDPESEYHETMNKLRALLKAGGIDGSFDR